MISCLTQKNKNKNKPKKKNGGGRRVEEEKEGGFRRFLRNESRIFPLGIFAPILISPKAQ